MGRRKADNVHDPATRGNFVSEWFGHRVYPRVAKTRTSLNDQKSHRCPFLTQATKEDTECVKPSTSIGICTISSTSNGPREDWLVCPYRALDVSLLEIAAQRFFRTRNASKLLVTPAPTLARKEIQKAITEAARSGRGAIVYLQDKLGGEISIPPTDRSPELAFDITMVEIVGGRDRVGIGRYGILEVQTMDFHGSYRYVAKNLTDALRLHAGEFPKALAQNQTWLSDHIEGPNIANVFKRTFYQIMLKFQIGATESCAGCILALPESVWDSWQRHLGKPELEGEPSGTYSLLRPGATFSGRRVPAWILVFDIDSADSASPNPIRLLKTIATDADSISYYALKVAPEAAVGREGSAVGLPAFIRKRLGVWWPELQAPVQ